MKVVAVELCGLESAAQPPRRDEGGPLTTVLCFGRLEAGTPVTASLRNRICERILNSRIPSVLVVVEGGSMYINYRLNYSKAEQCATWRNCTRMHSTGGTNSFVQFVLVLVICSRRR